MPRKRSRYGRLLRELKTTGGNTANGSELDNFLKFLTGQSKIQVNNKPDEKALKRYNVAIHPFAVEGDDATANGRYKVGITGYSYNGIAAAGLDNSDLGIFFIQGGEEDNAYFYPALIKPSFLASGYSGNANKVSAVTGKTYNYVPTRTFSIPFGRTTSALDAKDGSATSNLTASDELDVMRSLKTKIADGSATASLKSISYEPEFFNEVSQAKDVNAASDIPNTTVSFAT